MMQSEDGYHGYREQIASAISWELIYQLMRRYHATYDFRIWETHPGGGQYDCLSIYSPSRIHHFDFNLQAQSLHIWANSKYIERLDIISEYLHCNNPKELVEQISSLAQLKSIAKLPQADGSVIACGVIATLFKLYIFSLFKLKMFMGYCDSSGYDNGIRRDKFLQFPSYKKLLGNIKDDNDSFSLYKFFFLENISINKILCIFDMSGRLVLPSGEEILLEDMYNIYNRDINLLSSHIAAKLFN